MTDTKCPLCGFPGAYVGLTVVECINVECKAFCPKAYAEVQKQVNEQIQKEAHEERMRDLTTEDGKSHDKIYFTAEWWDHWQDNGVY